MKISIAVHGRFHAYDLAAALLRRGAHVTLLTSARAGSVRQWFPREHTRILRRHFLLDHAARRLAGGEPPAFIEARLKQMFGGWAARRHIAQQPDVIHCWSGVAEESLRACREQSLVTLARGSAHIRTQQALLAEEEARTGVALEKPRPWIVGREEREYELAQVIVVPSTFAQQSFLEQGVSADKLRVVPLATRATGFAGSPHDIAARVTRVRSQQRLRVLYVGSLSFRKGMQDMQTVLHALGGRMDFRFVGPVLDECRAFARQAADHARVDEAVPEAQLPAVYAWGDVFVLPTLEDGFAVVLAQAQAAGLPIITTTNSGGPDIISDGGEGFVIPIRNPEAIIERLVWYDEHRAELARSIELLRDRPPARDWDQVAQDFVQAMRP